MSWFDQWKGVNEEILPSSVEPSRAWGSSGLRTSHLPTINLENYSIVRHTSPLSRPGLRVYENGKYEEIAPIVGLVWHQKDWKINPVVQLATGRLVVSSFWRRGGPIDYPVSAPEQFARACEILNNWCHDPFWMDPEDNRLRTQPGLLYWLSARPDDPVRLSPLLLTKPLEPG